jgi:hypothetical protein
LLKLRTRASSVLSAKPRRSSGASGAYTFSVILESECRGAMGIAGGLRRVKPEPFCLFLGAAEVF